MSMNICRVILSIILPYQVLEAQTIRSLWRLLKQSIILKSSCNNITYTMRASSMEEDYLASAVLLVQDSPLAWDPFYGNVSL